MSTAAPRRSTGTDIALIAGFAALIAVCAISPAISIGGPVPVTLQTFGVLLSGAVLGARRGFLAALLYVVAGAAGLPIFSGGAAGLAVLTGPSAGYLVGFPLAAGLCGLIVERLPRSAIQTSLPLIFAAGLASSAVCIHTLGMAGLVLRIPTTWERRVRDRQVLLARRRAQEHRGGDRRHRRAPGLPRPPRGPAHRAARGRARGVSRIELDRVTVRFPVAGGDVSCSRRPRSP